MITPKPGVAEVEPLSSNISSRTESEVAYPPKRERNTMVDKKGLEIEDGGEMGELPTAVPSVPATRQQPGRLESLSDDETGRGSIVRAPRK